jgi:hypothetical protein
MCQHIFFHQFFICEPFFVIFSKLILKNVIFWIKKRFSGFPVPSQDATYQTLRGRE